MLPLIDCFLTDASHVTPIIILTESDWDAWASHHPKTTTWLTESGKMVEKSTSDPNLTVQYRLESGSLHYVPCLDHAQPGQNSGLWIFYTGKDIDYSLSGNLAAALPEGDYVFTPFSSLEAKDVDQLYLGWALGAYQYDRYLTAPKHKKNAKLYLSPDLLTPQQRQTMMSMVEGIYLTRNITNSPAEDMSPAQLAKLVTALCQQHQADYTILSGDDLLEQNFPTIHRVGRAAECPPHLIELNWHPREHEDVENLTHITLVGKGVCFDSGGLDLKSAEGMRLMKKDKGGAAQILGLAHTLMCLQAPIQLRVLIPAVENAVSATAYRPGDIIMTRHGTSVEVGNTDAEGRLILCDALAYACERAEPTDLIIDCATLTGAARIALGTDLPALFSNNDDIANLLLSHSEHQKDPLWRMPLHSAYRKHIKSKVADLNNAGSPYGGAILAALFLEHFVKSDIPWVHIDLMGWNRTARTAHPEGGEAQGFRAILHALLAFAEKK